MSSESANNADDPTRDEMLVAYLDGELDPESSRDVEERLAQHVDVRERLHELERAWDVLDALPSTDVSPQFANTTLELIAQTAEREQRDKSAGYFSPRVRRTLTGALALLVAFGLGLFVSANRGRAENEQLVNELPILQDLDAYRRAGDIEFLRMMNEAELFPAEKSHEG